VNPATPELPNPSASGDPYGPQRLIANALSKVCLSDQQRVAIEQLGKEVRAKEDAVGEARHSFIKALAEQLRLDHVNAGALKPEIDALVKARDEASPVMRKALEDLHGILDPGQRKAFVEAIESDMKALGDASKTWFDSFASDLGLTDGQKERIRTDLTQAHADAEMDRDVVKAEFDAFKGDTFPIEKTSPESDVGKEMRMHAEKMVAVAKQVADILTPQQRSKLADRIEDKPVSGAPIGAPVPLAPLGTSRQGLIVGGGYRAGVLGGWGGGYVGRVGYFGGLGMGYGAGYPFIGTWRPGIW
jgi:Spy/CpxP family protein refolding chaperone